MSLETVDVLSLEQAWNQKLMQGNGTWNAMRSTHRLYVQEREHYVVWRATPGVPRVLEVYTVAGTALSPTSGLTVQLQPTYRSSQDRQFDLVLGSTPREMPESGMFAWVPRFAHVRFTPAGYGDIAQPSTLSVPLVIRTASNPVNDRAPGGTYFTKLSQFMEWFPGVRV